MVILLGHRKSILSNSFSQWPSFQEAVPEICGILESITVAEITGKKQSSYQNTNGGPGLPRDVKSIEQGCVIG